MISSTCRTGEQMRAARAYLGWSRAELARMSGVSEFAVAYSEISGPFPKRWGSARERIIRTLEDGGIEFAAEAERLGVRPMRAREAG